ncbi:MAG: hypothetical protein SVR08_04520 [Spirochaetota bacterium]|nr:hypothetical protein [Spirochaetota bacterium]
MRNFSDIREWHNNQILERLSEKLKKRDFNSLILNTKDEIIEYIKKNNSTGCKCWNRRISNDTRAGY